MKILIATSNLAKVARIRKMLIGHNIQILTPIEVGLSSIEIKEGNDIVENATQKALAYMGLIDLPILGTDTSLTIPGEKLNPAMVKRNALENLDESSLTIEDISSRIIIYYRKIILARGDNIPSYWEDAFALVSPDGTIKQEKSRRDIILTHETRGPIDPFVPLRSMYIGAATGKYPYEQTTEDENIELRPIKKSLFNLLNIA